MVVVPVSTPEDQYGNGSDPHGELQGVVDRLFPDGTPISVLDAGCGSGVHVGLSRTARIVGIDICKAQLDRNRYIGQKILGDIQVYDIGKDRFDLIMCWDVLEHLPEPEKALRSFVRAVKREGVILLALPNVYSLKGLITKFTPHWFHVWVYRRIFKSKNAGKPGYSPFPTFLRPKISIGALQRFAAENNLLVEYFLPYEGSTIKNLESRSQILYGVYKLALVLLGLVSLGTYDGSKSDFFIIFRRQGSAKRQASAERQASAKRQASG